MTFAEKYFSVFDAQTGKMRNCGRDACKTLIQACQEISPNTYFGDIQTGCVDMQPIKYLALKIGVIATIK